MRLISNLLPSKKATLTIATLGVIASIVYFLLTKKEEQKVNPTPNITSSMMKTHEIPEENVANNDPYESLTPPTTASVPVDPTVSVFIDKQNSPKRVSSSDLFVEVGFGKSNGRTVVIHQTERRFSETPGDKESIRDTKMKP